MEYLVAGYLVIWLVSFVFIFTMVRRQRTLQREIEQLQQFASEHPQNQA